MARSKSNAGKSSEKLRKKISRGKKKSALKRFLFVFVLLAVTAAVFLIILSKYVFKISKFEINGNQKYSDKEILEIGNLYEGMELYSIPLKQTEQSIKENLPYIKSAKLVQIPPSTLKINISVERGTLGVKLGGDYYILSNDFKVLEKISSVEEAEEDIIDRILAENIIIFKTNAIKECYVGKKIKFQDTDIADFLSELLRVVEENQIYGIIKEIDVTNKFDVTMNYDNRFLIRVKSFEDIGEKILSSVLVMDELNENDRGEIERTDNKRWAFNPNDKIFR